MIRSGLSGTYTIDPAHSRFGFVARHAMVKHVGDAGFEVTGQLTIRGVTREITIPLEFAGTAVDVQGLTRAGFEGSTVINRKDYGVSFNAVLETGGVMICEKITLEFDLSAVKNA
ncbi:YceI family protein [Nonomuraea diastatica]|nr:YceI family protein [Nonomuraea diastatica]